MTRAARLSDGFLSWLLIAATCACAFDVGYLFGCLFLAVIR